MMFTKNIRLFMADRMHACFMRTTGFTCELCLPGYYKAGEIDDCHLCPCYKYGTESTVCGYSNKTLTCTQCKPGYAGALCER